MYGGKDIYSHRNSVATLVGVLKFIMVGQMFPDVPTFWVVFSNAHTDECA